MGHDHHNIEDYDKFYREFKLEVPEYYNFGYDVIDKWAERDRNKLAMIWVDQQGRERKYTFRDLRNLSNHAANILIKYGISKGDRIFIMLPRLPEWWIFSLAMIKLGVVQCTAPGLLMPKDIEYRINAGKFKMAITDTTNATKFDEVCDQCPTLSNCILVDGERRGWISYRQECALKSPISHHEVNNPFQEKTRADDPMFMFFTSGTSKNPKMVLHDYSYPLGHQITGKYWHDLRSTDLHFAISDTGWGKCAWGKYFGQWLEGACVFVYDIRGKFNAEEILPLICQKYEITTFCASDDLPDVVLADLAKFDFSQLRHCCAAGEPLHPDTIRLWREGTGLEIHEGYGQTETVCMIAMFPGLDNRAGSIGKASPGWNIELHDNEGHPVPVGEDGRIAVKLDPRPVGLFCKYVNSAADQNEAFSNGFYYTGDKARIDADGYFYFCRSQR